MNYPDLRSDIIDEFADASRKGMYRQITHAFRGELMRDAQRRIRGKRTKSLYTLQSKFSRMRRSAEVKARLTALAKEILCPK